MRTARPVIAHTHRVLFAAALAIACVAPWPGHDVPAARAGTATVVRPRFLFIQDTSGSMVQTPTQVPLSLATDYPLADATTMACSANPTTTTSCTVDTSFTCTSQSDCTTAHGAGWNCSPSTGHCQTCCDSTGTATNGSFAQTMSEVCNTKTSTCWFADGVPTHGDGSVDQPGCDENGDGLENDSKIYQAKAALRNILAGYPEVEFALERYHSIDNRSITSTACGPGDSCSTDTDCPNDPDFATAIWSCDNPTGAFCAGTCRNCSTLSLPDDSADSTWVFDGYGECGSSFSCTGTALPGPTVTAASIYRGLCTDWDVDGTCSGDASLLDGLPVTCASGNASALPDSSYCIDYVGPQSIFCHQAGSRCSTAGDCCSGDCSSGFCLGNGPTCAFPTSTGAPTYGGGGDILVPFSSTTDTTTQILPWINDDESDGEELRATGDTPIAASLATAKSYLLSASGPLASDPSIPCRSYSVIFLTDGAETCGGDPATEAAALRNLIVARTGDPACTAPTACPKSNDVCYQGTCREVFNGSINTTLNDGSCASPCASSQLVCDAAPGTAGTCQAVVDVKTYVIGFNLCPAGGDLCPDGQSLDAIAAAGGTGKAYVATNEVDIEAAISGIVAGAIKPELCNGIDDNCNGLVDEGYNVGTPCTNGALGDCKASGVIACVPASIDPTQTTTYCTAPVCASLCPYSSTVCALVDTAPPAVCPTTETCTNGDADCDGIISASCPPACSNPQPEVCNGADDNCNGVIDECTDTSNPGCVTYGPGGGLSCGSSIGVCKPGVTECCTPSREGPIAADTTNAVAAPGVVTVGVTNGHGIEPGITLTVDSGASQEQVVVTAVGGASPPTTPPTSFTAVFAKAHASGVLVTGTTTCSSATAGTTVCVGGTGPSTAVESNSMGLWCNGLDDDCNGLVDDGITRPCYPSTSTGCTANPDGTYTCLGTCKSGTQTCVQGGAGTWGACVGAVTPSPDIACSGVDTDCDGIVPGPKPEVCNGIDDDCDGVIDDHLTDTGGECYPSGTAGCTLNPDGKTYTCKGTCAPGTLQCVGGKLVCEGAVTPATEVCDGKDNNCNGVVDETPLPGVGVPCATAGSACPGLTACVSGAISCMASGGGAAGTPCYPPGTKGCTLDPSTGKYTCLGICKPGMIECVGGADVCEGAVTPGTEVCNGLDNDCDGVIPPDAPCPVAGDVCDMGTCVAPCPPENICPSGFVCEPLDGGHYCVPNKCVGVTCPTGDRCDATTGMCVDPCAGVTCAAGQTCVGGVCEDCTTLGCPTGQICLSGVCQTDPCAGKTCPAGDICMEPSGNCVSTCSGVTCPAGQICQDGSCVTDKCSGVTCPAGETCSQVTGACVTDVCTAIQCPPGEACVGGNCIADPCRAVRCGAHQQCTVDDMTGAATCQACTHADGGSHCTPLNPGTPVLATGGGGCQCQIGAAGGGHGGGVPIGSGLELLAGLSLLGLAARRRTGGRAARRRTAGSDIMSMERR